tara:strand:- start:58 stop:339 length:282 start_codon:yes stop_codon:yes gene_type:complete
MIYTIVYHGDVVKEDIPKLSNITRKRVKKSIETKMMTHPNVYAKPLCNSLKGYWKLRVGDCRIIFRIQKQMVIILVIQHRKEVYQNNIIKKRG